MLILRDSEIGARGATQGAATVRPRGCVTMTVRRTDEGHRSEQPARRCCCLSRGGGGGRGGEASVFPISYRLIALIEETLNVF